MGKCKDAFIEQCNELTLSETSVATPTDNAVASNDERDNCYACVRNKTQCSIHDKSEKPRTTIIFQRVQELELSFSAWRAKLISANPYDRRYEKAKLLPVWKQMCKRTGGVVMLDNDYEVPDLVWDDLEYEVDKIYEEAVEAEEEDQQPKADRR